MVCMPLLFFTCTVCPTGHMGDTTSHKAVSLVFFNTFEPFSLTPESCKQRKGVTMLYERVASQVPLLYVCPSGKRPWTGASDSMLPGLQLSQYNSSLLQG